MHEEQCTCCRDGKLPDGVVMGTAVRAVGNRFAGIVMCFELLDGNEGETEILWEGQPVRTPRTAQREAMRRYWPLYEFRNGFKHPEDPSRTASDPAPTMNVISEVWPL